MRLRHAWLAAGLVGLLPGCFTLTDFDGDIQDTREETFTLPYVQNLSGFDILFVLDSSGSMAPMLDGMGAYAPGMLGSLDYAMENAQAESQVLHIGVITPNLGTGAHAITYCENGGDRGELQTVVGSGCPPLQGDYLVVENGVVTNMGAVQDVAEALQCLIDGQVERGYSCGFEQPLAAVAKAIDPVATPANQGFLRSNAGLAVVLMTDEDDCSARSDALFDPAAEATLGPLKSFRCFEWGITCDEDPRSPGEKHNCRPRTEAEGGLLLEPMELADRIFAHKDPGDVVFATLAEPAFPVVVGLDPYEDPEVSSACSADGAPGIRLKAFLDLFEDNGLSDDMCAPSLEGLLFQISERMASQAVSRCMPKAPADTDSALAGVQVDCTAWDVTELGTVNEWRSEPIISCEDTADVPPCWKVMQDQICTSGYKMEVFRDDEPPAGSIMEATCSVLLD